MDTPEPTPSLTTRFRATLLRAVKNAIFTTAAMVLGVLALSLGLVFLSDRLYGGPAVIPAPDPVATASVAAARSERLEQRLAWEEHARRAQAEALADLQRRVTELERAAGDAGLGPR